MIGKEDLLCFPFRRRRRHTAVRGWKVERAFYVCAVNGLGRLLGAWGKKPMRGERLLEKARRQTGLEDFGEPSIEEPLFHLISSMEAEARLNLVGRLSTRQDLLRLLINRLRLEADRKLNPAIDEVAIQRPIFITGLPRTGTSLLHRLLGLDPANRVVQTWEAMYPSPPPLAATYHTDRRIVQVERQLRWFHRIVKHFNRIHPIGARLPEECLVLFSLSLLSYQFETTHRLPAYLDWLLSQDLRPAYAVHRRALQHLQWGCAKERWVLKAPAHLFDLEALFSVYPDAGIVMTHRNPLEAAASNASLTAALRSAFSDEVDLLELGPECSRRWAEAVNRATLYRDNGNALSDRFLDVHYADLLKDPIGTVRKVYAYFELPIPVEMEENIRAFLLQNPQNRFGRHHYRLEDYGLSVEEETTRYAAYRQRFKF